MAQSSSAPVLDLGDLSKRPTVLIRRKSYELKSSDEFTWMYYSGLLRKYGRLGELLSKPQKRKSVREWKEQSYLQDWLLRLVLIAPESVQESLGDLDRLRIIRFFLTQVEIPKDMLIGAQTSRNNGPRQRMNETK